MDVKHNTEDKTVSVTFNYGELLVLNGLLAESAKANAVFLRLFDPKGSDGLKFASYAALAYNIQDAIHDCGVKPEDLSKSEVREQIEAMNTAFMDDYILDHPEKLAELGKDK